MALSVNIDTTNSLVGDDLDLVKAYLNEEDETGFNNILNFYVNAASQYCNQYTDRLLRARELTEYYDGKGQNIIMLNNYPVQNITAVYDDPGRVWDADTEILTDNLVIRPDKLKYMIVYDNGRFLDGRGNVKVIYNAGYSGDSIPDDLKMACLGIIGTMWYSSQEKRLGTKSKSLGEGTISYETDFPKWIMKILEKYRKKW